MFSDSRAPAEHRAFKPHAPHFIPWLRNSLKSQRAAAADLGLGSAYKSNPELHHNSAPLERTRGMGIFSIPGKNKAKKSEPRCNGAGVARMLPAVLRGHHILGKMQKDAGSPAKCHRDESPVKKQAPPPSPALPTEAPVCVEERRADVWDYTIHQRDLQSSVWLSSNPRGPKDVVRSSFGYIRRNCQSQRDLTVLREAPPVEGVNGVVFSAEVPRAALGFTTTLRGPGKRGSKRVPPGCQSQNGGVRHRAKSEEEAQGPACSRKVVRRQLKKVMDNLEQVLTALRDVQQEMKEVVQQIDYLTSCVDLDDQDPHHETSSSSGSSSDEVTVISAHPWASQSEDRRGTTLRRGPPNGGRPPPLESRCQRSVSAKTLGSPPKRGGLLTLVHNAESSSLSPQRSLPVRPPTPGLSPLTVNHHAPGSPSSSVMISPISPVSPRPHATAVLCPSVVVDRPPTVRICPPATRCHPSASCPPTDSETLSHGEGERRASSTGPPLAAPAKPGQGRRGRKPPPYPHHRFSQPSNEPREAPPYPERRRLLSTTV
nr:arginine-glutamic acid dipeptide repeats protein-like [Nerophis lumbriciformis]